MADRYNRRGYIPENDDSQESTSRSLSPSARSRPYHPTVAYYQPRGYVPPSGRRHPYDGFDDEEEEEEEQEDYGIRAGESNDNPLYEDEESRFPDPAASRQGSPNTNPLYGNDPFKPVSMAAVCMTEFLKPKGSSPKGSGYSLRGPGQNIPRQLEDGGNSNFIDESSDDEDPQSSRLRTSPPVRSPPPRRNIGKGLVRAGGDQTIMRYPPARFSPVLPASNQLVYSPKDKRLRQRQAATTSGSRLPIPQPFSAPNIGDLIAAVRSDKNLLLGEVRKHANREPRVPGDHDRFFAPRKGDIIIHFTPSLDDNKLLEYYDERKSMLRLQPGDKLVRVKYDNYKLPDHLMITSKLYVYAPEWVYLGKALQTIKTA